VRTRAGLFDVSHMGEVEVKGEEALAYLQHVTCNDVSRLGPGRIQYSALTTPEGTFVDDLLVYKRGEADYLLVINAGNTPKDVDWLRYHAKGFDVRTEDVSDAWCQIALQGPRAQEILAPLTPAALPGIKYYAFERTEVAGTTCIVSRTGYTGEDGFEIYGPADAAEDLWHAVLGAGAPHGLVPAGLAARDTLRLEAKMALYGNDIDDTVTPFEAGLSFIVKLEKGASFTGQEALKRQKLEGVKRRLIGFRIGEERVVARPGMPVFVDGAQVDVVRSGTITPTIGTAIGTTFLPVDATKPGTRFEIEVRGKKVPAEVVKMPFVETRTKK
jgi:aminomethyltransferase